MTRATLAFGLLLLVVLRDDFWLGPSSSRVLGLPAALAYQVVLCLAASLLMWAFVRLAWPGDEAGDSE